MKQETTTFEQPVIFRMATPGDAEEILELYQSATAAGMKNGTVLWPLRVAISGQASTPGGAIEIAWLLGKEVTLRRLDAAINALTD